MTSATHAWLEHNGSPSSEDPLLNLLACPAEMLSYFLQNRGESSNPQRMVAPNGDVVLSSLLCGEPKVAARLASNLIAEGGERLSQVLARDIARELIWR
jgi:hypothetical protein